MLEEKLGTEKLKCVLNIIAQERPNLAFAPNDIFAVLKGLSINYLVNEHNRDY